MAKPSFFLLLFLPCIVLALSFHTQLIANDAGTAATATFGVEPTATNGYDIGIDSPYFPFPLFAIYFAGDTGILGDMTTDIRSDRDSLQIWKLSINMPSSPTTTILWTLSDLPDSGTIRCGELLLGEDSVSLWNDMHSIDNIEINSYSQLVIEFRPPPREPTGDTIPPVAVDWLPTPYSTDISGSTSVAVSIVDSTSDVDSSSVHLIVNGMDITFVASVVRITNGYRIAYDPFIAFSPGTVWVTVEAADRAFPANSFADTIWFVVGASSDTITGFTVRGMVMLSPPTMPLSGTMVEVTDIGLWDSTGIVGSYSIDSIPEGEHTIKATREGYARAETTIIIISDTTINFTLTRADTTGFIIDGTVTLSGASDHSGTIVTLDTIGVDTTDVMGNFLFTAVPPGIYLLRATHDGYIADSTFITVMMGDTTVNLTLLPSGGTLESKTLPTACQMSIFPNPFNRKTTLKIISPAHTDAVLHISNIVGKSIADMKIMLQVGENTIMLDLPDDTPSGIYRITLETNEMHIKTKAVYIR